MRLPNFRRIIKTDYQAEYQQLVEQLGVSLNYGIEVLYQALNRGITLKDNVQCTVKQVDVSVTAAGVPTSPTGFNVDINGMQVSGISVLRAINLTNPSVYPSGSPFISYTQNNNLITINHITGLPISNQFRLTVIAWGS